MYITCLTIYPHAYIYGSVSVATGAFVSSTALVLLITSNTFRNKVRVNIVVCLFTLLKSVSVLGQAITDV